MMKHKYVVITRPQEDSEGFTQKLEKEGIKTFHFPTIAIAEQPLTPKITKTIKDIEKFDWIVFTSHNGIYFFIKALQMLDIPLTLLKTKHIAAVGPRTAEAIKKYDLPVTLIPTRFTTEDLAQAFSDITDKKILLPRASIATPFLTKKFKEKGADVINISMYQTLFPFLPTEELEKLLETESILCITFTSPSTVKGFITNIQKIKKYERFFSLPTLAIGTVTAKALRQYGFNTIYTADMFTTDGMIEKLRQNLL